MGQKREEACLICDLDDSPYPAIGRPYSVSQLVYDQTDGGCYMFFVKWKGIQICCDVENRWAFSDVTQAAKNDSGAYSWKVITPPFDSLHEALDYPILDGHSIRDRWDEIKLYSD